MSSKQMIFDNAALLEMKDGVQRLARAVKVTMGPTGRNAVMDKSYGGPAITKDGVSVAKEITLAEPFSNMGAKMVYEVAKKTGDKAGDGTTAATVLAEAIFTEGLRNVADGANPVHIQRDQQGGRGCGRGDRCDGHPVQGQGGLQEDRDRRGEPRRGDRLDHRPGDREGRPRRCG